MAALHEVDIFSTPIHAAGYISVAGESPRSKVRPLWKLSAPSQGYTMRVRGQIWLLYTRSVPFLWALLLARTIPIALQINYFGVNKLKWRWMENKVFALVHSVWYQEGKLILDARAYWQIQICVCAMPAPTPASSGWSGVTLRQLGGWCPLASPIL